MRYKFRAWHKTAMEMLYEDYYGGECSVPEKWEPTSSWRP